MRVGLLVLLLCVGGSALAKRLDAGMTFFNIPRQSLWPQVVYRYDNGFGWHQAKGTFQYGQGRPYDYRLVPLRPLRIEARLLDDGKERARAGLRIHVQGDRRYDIHADVSADDPTRSCFGCVRPAASAPIVGNPTERFWLWYSFNGISHPLIF